MKVMINNASMQPIYEQIVEQKRADRTAGSWRRGNASAECARTGEGFKDQRPDSEEGI